MAYCFLFFLVVFSRAPALYVPFATLAGAQNALLHSTHEMTRGAGAGNGSGVEQGAHIHMSPVQLRLVPPLQV